MSTCGYAPAAVPPAPLAFSTAELGRRRRELRQAAALAGAQALVVYGANRSGSAVPWLTGWGVTREAALVLATDGAVPTGLLLVAFRNHGPDAARAVAGAGTGDEVRPILGSTADEVRRALRDVAPRSRRVAVVGSPPPAVHSALAADADVVPLDAAYLRLRRVKSGEELAFLSHAAALTDVAAAHLLAAAAVGASEWEMVAAAEHAYRRLGGSHHICYVSTTSMAAPDRCVPAQWPSERRAAPGSAVVFELSAGWGHDYPAQLLRTATVQAEPAPLYRRLHEVAVAVHDGVLARVRAGADPADLLEALQPAADAGLVVVDDLVHGLGGGYLPPVLRDRGPLEGPHAEPLAEDSVLVVQPNVCTPDLAAGVQTGAMVVVTEDGWRPLHRFPAGLLEAGAFAAALASTTRAGARA